ncbi:dihydrofolate reductase family protein [Rhizobium tubonense]|uniref:Pyrimidine reductase n=1 Tax=Rhizobium tubonense TaxID=484088 RepID=A0A2W4CYI0_9HYPH|nr:RibD family protein [Rhizobium tubonense]PZM17189.1 pyrimidine reductase [Rhizobium tubonense]
MKPRVIMHMASSIDGRIATKHWPEDMMAQLHAAYERIHHDLKGDAWIVGRITMADFAEGDPQPTAATETYPRATWKAANRGPYAIAVDQSARLHMNIGQIGGDPLVMILTEEVSDDHLAELRRDGISYIFAGRSEIDLSLALEILAEDFGIERLLLEGGGGINGTFLTAGLVDEISLLLLPIADGIGNTPTTFDRLSGDARHLSLKTVERLEQDVLHLRYDVL